MANTVSFDIETAKKIALDLNELDGYRAKEPFQLNQIKGLALMNQNKDSIILNLSAQISILQDIGKIDKKQNELKPLTSLGWLKWLFFGIGLFVGRMVF